MCAAAATVALQHLSDAEGYVTACRSRCGHWQTCFDVFAMGNSKIDFLLFVVSPCVSVNTWRLLARREITLAVASYVRRLGLPRTYGPHFDM
jgi:hypothetical protein